MGEMKIYRVEIHRIAEKGIKRLPKEYIGPVWDNIRNLGENPFPQGCIQLKGSQDIYRIRVGDYRVIYAVMDDRLLVLVLEVGPRGSVYKKRS